jgi:uncharacterized protein (UPF0548 family)
VEGEEPYLFWGYEVKGQSYHAETILLSKILLIVTVTFDLKINRVLPLPQGNHVAKFGKDPIYKTKAIVRKHVNFYNSVVSA